MSKTRNPDALIRIEDAIKVLCREKCYPGALCPDNYCAEMWDEFEDVERVDAVPVRHGRWKEDTGGYGFWICSACGFVSEASAANMLYKFCPVCGAKMDEKELFGNSEQLNDLISRQAAIDALAEWHDEAITNRFNNLPSAQQNCDGCKWSDAIGYGECHHCKRAFEDMYEKGEQP